MATFAIDLLSGNEFLFNGNFSSSGNTPSSGSTYPEENIFAELPIPASDYTGEIYVVRSGSGAYGVNRKDAGMYFSIGGIWRNMNNTPAYFASNNFQVYDNNDTTKGVTLVTSGITSGNFRKLYIQNNDGIVAYLNDLNIKLDKTIFDSYSGTTVPSTYLMKTAFNVFTGTTLPANYYNKIQINSYTGITNTLISNKLNTSTFNAFTGTTLPANYYNKSQINNYSASTETELNLIENYLGNGIISGFTISINSTPTKININSGLGYMINVDSNPLQPIKTIINYSGKTGIAITNISTNIATYIAIDSSSNVIQQVTPFTMDQRRNFIILGAVIHSNKSTINAINNLPDVIINAYSQFNDLLDSLRNFNISGNVFSPNGANLSINKSLGYLFKRGVNFNIDKKNPHVIQLVALLAPSNIRYRLSDGTEYPDTNVISKYYESAPGIRTVLPNNRYSIQRITLFPSNLVRIQYGQAVYNTQALAIQSIISEPFVVEQNISDNGLLRAYLIINGAVTALNDNNDALFIAADKFGYTPIGSTGGVTTLQQAYGNSVIPQIITTTALGAVSLRRGSAADTDSVFTIQNGTGNTTISLIGDGTISLNKNVVFPKTSGFGIKIDTGVPNFGWRDLIGNVNPRAVAPNQATLRVYRGGQIREWAFANGDRSDNSFHIPHDYAPGTDMYIHVHWSHNGTSISGNAVMNFYISYSKGYSQGIFSAEKNVTLTYNTVNIATTPQYAHRIDEIIFTSATGTTTTLDRRLIEPDGLILVNFDFTTIPTIGGGSPNNPFVHFIDIHYQSTAITTKNKNFPFYT